MNTVRSSPRAPSLALTVTADRSLLWSEGDSVRYLVATLAAQDFPAPTAAASPALNLALCIDVSGSMSGDRLEAARQAAASLVDALTDRDCLSIVSFSGTAQVHLGGVMQTAAGKRAAKIAIAHLQADGGTNLFGGWFTAAECVAEQLEANPQASARVVLLSDGHANVGLTDQSEIATHCGELANRGVLTTSVGIGDGYSEELLGAMAEAGGGRMHDAERIQEIVPLVLAELAEGRRAALERVRLRVDVPTGVRKIEVVGAWAHHLALPALDVQVGTLFGDAPKQVVLRLIGDRGMPGDSVDVTVSATGVLPDGSTTLEAPTQCATFTFAEGRRNSAQPRHAAATDAAMRAWHAQIIRNAAPMNRTDRGGAQRYLHHELRYFDRYVRGITGGEELLAQLVRLTHRMQYDIGERGRKNLFRTGRLRSRGEVDLRPDWQQVDL